MALVFLGPDLHPCSVPLCFVGSNSNGAELGAVASGNPNEPQPAWAVPRTTSQAGCSKSLEGPGMRRARRWSRAWYRARICTYPRLRNAHVVRRRAAFHLVSQAAVKRALAAGAVASSPCAAGGKASRDLWAADGCRHAIPCAPPATQPAAEQMEPRKKQQREEQKGVGTVLSLRPWG